MKKVNFLILFKLLSLINLSVCYSRFDDDDYNEFNSNFADPHLDIQRNVKITPPITPHLNDHHMHKISDSFDFNSDPHSFKDEFRRDPFKFDSFKTDPFKRDPFKSDYFMKTDPFKNDEFKTDIVHKIELPQPQLPSKQEKPTAIVVLKKKEPKNDNFNKSDSFVNEFNTNFDEINRIPDFDFHTHDSWFEQQNRDSDIPRRDRVSENLVNDYRQPTPRTPFRFPMIPVVFINY